MSYSRYAIYYMPPAGNMAEAGAAWLGWDAAQGREVAQPDVEGLPDVTAAPRKYGFHGTLKPPFVLRDGRTVDELQDAVSQLAAILPPARCDGLALSRLGRFLALTPVGDTQKLRQVASACVRDLDSFRAPAREAELARRRKAGLRPRQEALLLQWGYPYVMEEFRFHLTLTERLPKSTIPLWTENVTHHFPTLPAPFDVDQIVLSGEREDGRFELVHRYTLAG